MIPRATNDDPAGFAFKRVLSFMSMLDPTASRFWQAAIQSGLVDATDLTTCWEAIVPEKRAAEHIDRRLARQAVQAGMLTLWQAQQLVAGRSSGFKLDRYLLLELIGQGGMGRVYLARDTRLNRRVALKILSPERVNNPRAIERFRREARVGAQLQHENLVRVYDVGELNAKCYLVMEYIEGKNIGQMIAENGPLPAPLAARLCRQVALGLEHAQRKGLIHRDVNPYNILVTRDGTAKLTDLGLAIDLAEQDRVTRDGATVGTFDYVSPEQARHSHGVDTRADIYSLGCSLYHMLAGQVPFPSASLPEKLYGHQMLEPPCPTTLVPGIPSGLAAVVSRTMKKAPADRYATPLELAQALEPFSEDYGGEALHSSNGAAGSRIGPVMTQVAVPAVGFGAADLDTAIPGPIAASFPTPGPPAVAASTAATDVASPAPEARVAPPPPRQTAREEAVRKLALSVDFGPEPSISEALTSVKTKLKPKPKPKVKPARVGQGGRLPEWAVPAGGAGAVLLMAGVLLALQSLGGGTSPTISTKPRDGEPSKPTTRGPALDPKVKGQEKKLQEPRGKEIRVVDGDGTPTNEPDLASALRRAVGSKGYVLLVNRSPLYFSADEAIRISGRVEIRGREGIKPVIVVEVRGGKPFLTTLADSALRLEGVTIVARYVDLPQGPTPAPVIEAGGDVVLDRCSFSVEAATAGGQALLFQGKSLEASGCWFENFEQAIAIDAYGGSTTLLRHCMFIRLRTESPGGWAVRVRRTGGGAKTGRKLDFDHCTIKGEGFLALSQFTDQSPLAVDVKACAVMTESLISWEAESPDKTPTRPTRKALAWRGQENQLDVRGKSWVLSGPVGAATGPMADGPNDLESWTKQLGAERDPVPPPIRFATDPSAVPEHPEPADFATGDKGKNSPGADPLRVGPGATPASSKP